MSSGLVSVNPKPLFQHRGVGLHPSRSVAARRTYEFLHTISGHLSSRKSCSKYEYVVGIGTDFGIPHQLELEDPGYSHEAIQDRIFFCPDVRVFRSNHHRKKTDVNTIVDHVLLYHFRDVYKETDSFGRIHIKEETLVPGIYKYQFDNRGEKRRWIKAR